MSISKSHLLSLPPEIIQSIYLHSLSPQFPIASPLLARALSTNHIYKLTFIHAFWNRASLLFAGVTAQQTYSHEPGPHVRELFHPLAVPMPIFKVEREDLRSQVQLQEIVLRCRWCGFSNTKGWLEETMQAVMKDLLGTLDLPLSQDDQTRLTSFIASLPASRSVFKAMALDEGSSITLQYPRPLATALLATYRGPDARFDQDSSPNLIIAPTSLLVLPPHVLMGKPEWSQEKVNELKMLASYVNLRTVKYQLEALHQGMSNAVVQRHYDALLTLLWLATRLAEFSDPNSTDENPFEPRVELFRHVARQNVRAFAATSDRLVGSRGGNSDVALSVRLFTLLLRAHAESMPQNDPEIEAWANSLRTWQYSSVTEVAFAAWEETGEESQTANFSSREHFKEKEGGGDGEKVQRDLWGKSYGV